MISEARTYYRNSVGQVEAAYLSQGRGLLAKNVLGSAYNTFLDSNNFIRLHNVTSATAGATVEVYDLSGNDLLAAIPVTIAPESTIELNLNSEAALSANTYGTLRVIPNTPGTIFGDALRVKSVSTNPGQIDFSKPIPFR